MVKKLLIGLALVAAVVVVVLIFQKPNGTLVIQTDPSADVSITGSDNKPRSLGKGSLSTHAAPGSYLITAASPKATSRAVVKVAGSKTTVSIPLTPAASSTYIASYATSALSVDKTDMKFLNVALGQVYEYDPATGAEKVIAPALTNVTQMFWLDHNQGIAVNNYTDAFKIQGQQAVGMPLVKASAVGNQLTYFNAAPNGGFAYAHAGSIYRYEPNSSIVKVSAYTTANVQLALAPNGTLFVNTFSAQDKVAAASSTAYLITGTGITALYNNHSYIQSASWSPDSNRLAINADDGFVVYDPKQNTSRSVKLRSLDAPNAFDWISDTRLVYLDSDQIWSYDSTTGVSTKLADSPGQILHDSPFVPGTDQSVFFGTDATDAAGTGAALYKISL